MQPTRSICRASNCAQTASRNIGAEEERVENEQTGAIGGVPASVSTQCADEFHSLQRHCFHSALVSFFRAFRFLKMALCRRSLLFVLCARFVTLLFFLVVFVAYIVFVHPRYFRSFFFLFYSVSKRRVYSERSKFCFGGWRAGLRVRALITRCRFPSITLL